MIAVGLVVGALGEVLDITQPGHERGEGEAFSHGAGCIPILRNRSLVSMERRARSARSASRRAVSVRGRRGWLPMRSAGL
jgi:hypothetical protein